MSNKDNSESKKVSRAESWRYEASMYVNPPNRPQVPIISLAAQSYQGFTRIHSFCIYVWINSRWALLSVSHLADLNELK